VPNIPCQPLICPGSDQASETDPPIINYSTEAPDSILFADVGFPWWNGLNPLPRTNNPNDPGFPPAFFAEGCISLCFSSESQEAARLCAAAQAFICAHTPHVGTGQTLFFNEPQQCTFTCEDGNLYTWNVPAGSFYSTTHGLANEVAKAYACQQAALHYICLSGITPNACLNLPYLNSVVVTGHGKAPFVFTVVSGSLPPGLHLNQTEDDVTEITGTPTSAGNFSFSIRATDADGNFGVKNYSIAVLGINNINALPAATEHTFYTAQLNAVGGTAPYTFTLVSGTVPGITLSSSGLLSGTPDYITAGTYPITVRVQDSGGNSCQYEGSIVINLRPGPDWTKLIWSVYSTTNGGAGSSASGSGSANKASGSIRWAGTLPFASIGPVQTTGILYTGPAVTARIRVTVSFSQTGGGSNSMAAEVKRNGLQIGSYGQVFTSGTFEFDINIPLSAGDAYSVDDIGGGNFWAICTGLGANASLSFSWAIFNV